MTYTVKREKLEAKINADTELREKEERKTGERGARLFRRIIGALLIVLAAVFGQALALVPTAVAFAIVFGYISAQVGLWVM